MQNLQTSQAYIFRILQHFGTKLGNFTIFNMLFLAVVKDFDFFAKMKIQFKRGMVHWRQSSHCLQHQIADFTYCAQRWHDETVQVIFEIRFIKVFLDIEAVSLTSLSVLKSYE